MQSILIVHVLKDYADRPLADAVRSLCDILVRRVDEALLDQVCTEANDMVIKPTTNQLKMFVLWTQPDEVLLSRLLETAGSKRHDITRLFDPNSLGRGTTKSTLSRKSAQFRSVTCTTFEKCSFIETDTGNNAKDKALNAMLAVSVMLEALADHTENDRFQQAAQQLRACMNKRPVLQGRAAVEQVMARVLV